jgi:hypothetical protein
MPVKKGGRNLLAKVEGRSKALLEGPGWVNKSTWLEEQSSGKLQEKQIPYNCVRFCFLKYIILLVSKHTF